MIRDAQYKRVTNIRADLRSGDIIRSNVSGNAYVVTAVYGQYAIAIDTIHVSVPEQWSVLRRHRVRRTYGG